MLKSVWTDALNIVSVFGVHLFSKKQLLSAFFNIYIYVTSLPICVPTPTVRLCYGMA